MRLDGKVIVIPGATSGLGKNAALRFAAAGAHVVFGGRRESAGNETAAEIAAVGGSSVFQRCDVTKSSDVAALVDTAVSRFGRLDMAYNVAGVPGDAFVKFAEYDEAQWLDTISINLTGMFYCMKYEIAAMLKNGGGAIVNMSSVAGLGATPGGAGYVASKHGIVGLTRTAALDYAAEKIRINAIAPGVVKTEMMEWGITQTPDLEAQMLAHQPIGRLGTMDEITNAAMWLCSDAASFVTGATLSVDGAYLLV
ncbi:MAG: SDR family oxidoreductase [Pseudomonadales bacterium]|nr:SDR family oxidoreductase [Pseudomonadales bacterium]